MDWVTQFDRHAADYLPDVKIAEEEPMSHHTSFRVGGPARRMAFPQRAEQMVLLLSLARECGARPLVIGNGTNLLVPDSGLDRLVIATAGLRRLEAGTAPDTVLAGAGVCLAQAADFACRQGLTGLEFAHGIPGTVGGAVYMNAGAYGGEMSQVVTQVTVVNREGETMELDNATMEFGYRTSIIRHSPFAVTEVVFCLERGEQEAVRAKMEELAARRREKQPLEYPSAGSTFKRPEGHFAGQLIMEAGFKGFQIGGARVSDKHCGFIVNTGNATAEDVRQVIEEIRRRVKERFHVDLETEVVFLG